MKLRLDRLASLYLVHPLLQGRTPRRLHIPILMYHSISDEDEGQLHPYYRTATAPRVFGEHIRYLHANGYRTLNLEEAVRRLAEPASPQKWVVITFDDGYADFWEHAYPVLAGCGFTATIFLPTAYIGETAQCFKGKPCLSWSQIRELCRAGISFGSHTVTHPQLALLTDTELEYEIAGSKREIEDNLGCGIESFAYPYAFPETQTAFIGRLRHLLSKAGYKNGVCTNIGTEDGQADRLFMRRLPINSCDDLPLFSAKLAGAYDWLAQPQRLVKVVKRRLAWGAATA
jgi:peptidoglycan/xylan/chitin deacetylase (PgdA/CDA1 family)